MTHTRLLAGGALVLAMTMGGCATELRTTADDPAAESPALVTQREARDLTFQFRQRAMELQEMAQRM